MIVWKRSYKQTFALNKKNDIQHKHCKQNYIGAKQHKPKILACNFTVKTV